MITLAHISDLHLDGGARNVARVSRIVDYLVGMPGSVDALLVTGDITDSGAVEDYAVAAKLLARLPMPVLCCPGNHDERTAFGTVLLGRAGSINQVHDIAGVAIILCDSTIPGRSEGELGAETLAWLDDALSRTGGRPALIVLHHPPVSLGIPVLDAIKLCDADRLAVVIGRHPHVAGILCGHAHTAAASTFAGVPVRVAPGVKSTTRLPWESAGDDIMAFDLPIALAFHNFADGVLTTHFRALQD
jgi:3',5'-cyclic-AMP phosphodiesterase